MLEESSERQTTHPGCLVRQLQIATTYSAHSVISVTRSLCVTGSELPLQLRSRHLADRRPGVRADNRTGASIRGAVQ